MSSAPVLQRVLMFVMLPVCLSAVGIVPVQAQTPWQPAYRFEIGDAVEFKFPYTPELDFSAPVRPDGIIYFPYLGDVMLLGRTVSELSETLRTRYVNVLKSAEVTIIVRSFQPMRVYVTGEVLTPGRIEFRQGLTVAQVVSSAGGFRDTANRNEVIVLRPATSTAMHVTRVSLARRDREADDQLLAPNDIVVVVKSKIARLGQTIRQYSRDLLPVSSLGLFFDLIGSTGASVVVGASEGGP